VKGAEGVEVLVPCFLTIHAESHLFPHVFESCGMNEDYYYQLTTFASPRVHTNNQVTTHECITGQHLTHQCRPLRGNDPTRNPYRKRAIFPSAALGVHATRRYSHIWTLLPAFAGSADDAHIDLQKANACSKSAVTKIVVSSNWYTPIGPLSL
jgi:hypothetical protein